MFQRSVIYLCTKSNLEDSHTNSSVSLQLENIELNCQPTLEVLGMGGSNLPSYIGTCVLQMCMGLSVSALSSCCIQFKFQFLVTAESSLPGREMVADKIIFLSAI